MCHAKSPSILKTNVAPRCLSLLGIALGDLGNRRRGMGGGEIRRKILEVGAN